MLKHDPNRRSRTSGEYFFASLTTPISQRLEPPANPGRFKGFFSKELVGTLEALGVRALTHGPSGTLSTERVSARSSGAVLSGTTLANSLSRPTRSPGGLTC